MNTDRVLCEARSTVSRAGMLGYFYLAARRGACRDVLSSSNVAQKFPRDFVQFVH